MTRETLYRQLPSVEELLNRETAVRLAAQTSRAFVAAETARVLASIRAMISRGEDERAVVEAIDKIDQLLERQVVADLRPSLAPVINATGVIIHTNLGRALLSESAVRAVVAAARSYTNLEYDVAAGKRSRRDLHAARLLAELLGCEAATVVNNNAAAVFLILNTLAAGREVIVSRGELVEIGGSFRIPEIMRRSGALLREIGTTNKTKLSDYQSAISDNTALVLRVHPSNYRIIGFTERPALEELAALARRARVPLVEDLGSGLLTELSDCGVRDEPKARESLAAGADLVCFSGDKLLGGPQAGIIAGREELIRPIRSNPLMRVLRVDKLTYAALEATLISYKKGKEREEIPVINMIAARRDDIERRARKLARRLRPRLRAELELKLLAGFSVVGGGSCPEVQLPTMLLALADRQVSPNSLEEKLRLGEPPVIARVEKDQVLVDLRTVLPEQEPALVEAMARL